MNITKLGEFFPADEQRSIILLTWQARKYLGDAEQRLDTPLGTRADWCASAASVLEAACVLLSIQPPNRAAARARVLLSRATLAAKAASANGLIAVGYCESASGPPLMAPQWDKQHVAKAVSVFRRAAEAGASDAHRALVELCELFPNAMPTEE